MNKGDIIHGYRILEDFKVAGGFSKITFGSKGGKEYFIKEFLAPKYPTPDAPGSERTKAKKRAECLEFEREQKALNEKLSSRCSTGGNLVIAVDFFREGATYYKITEKIDVSSISIAEISNLSPDQILLICKSVTNSLKIMHDLGIVHGDLKPDNILIKRASAGYVGKLIDLDDSYFSGKPPKHDLLVGTPEYYSPEQATYIMDEDEETSPSTLTCKSDIFTLGLIFHEYFTGRKPTYDKKYTSAWSAVADGASLNFGVMPEGITRLIRSMVSFKPCDRPSIAEVFSQLRNPNILSSEKTTAHPASSAAASETPSRGSSLRGKGLNIAKSTSATDTSSSVGSVLTSILRFGKK